LEAHGLALVSHNRPASARVLEVDPDLGVGIDRAHWQFAVAASIAPVFQIARGPWTFFPPPDPAGLGALVLSGMVVIEIDVGTRSHIELLGPGDVISPWVASGDDLAIPSEVTAAAVSDTRVALLDRAFSLRTARWPEIHAALTRRLVMRARRLSLQAAVNAVLRIEDRLELTLWELAWRFGRVTPQGTALDLPITHAQLAAMLAAQRPSVSMALGRLQANDRVIKAGRHRWLLRGEAPPSLARLVRASGLGD
jgi:CRP-like cAMP-binding protein